MPLKRVPRSQRETPEARALRAAVLEELRTPLVATSPKQQAKADRKAKKWVAALPKDAGEALAQIVAENAAELALISPVDHYAAQHGSTPEPASPEAVGPALATEAAPLPDEPPAAPKRRTRRPAGLVAVIDPRLYDTDEEDWT